jgi:hypothetical protein
MPGIKHTVVGKGIKVLKAETYTKAGDMWWMLLIEKPMPFKAVGDAAPDGFGTMAYHFPGWTLEARAAEYGLTDLEEVLELILYETISGFDKLDDARPYEEDEATCRSKKRSSVAATKKDHKITWANNSRQAFNAKVRFKQENIAAYKEMEVDKRRTQFATQQQVELRRSLAAAAANDEEDVGGPIAMAKLRRQQLQGRDGVRINGNKKLLRGNVVQSLETGEIEIRHFGNSGSGVAK